jgi:hypothetical protein
MTQLFALVALIFRFGWVDAGSTQEITPTTLVFNPISIQLETSGLHTLTPSEIGRIAAGSTNLSGIRKLRVTPDTFDFCRLGQQTVTLSIEDLSGNTTNRSGPIKVLPPAAFPSAVYVDAAYGAACSRVGFPNGLACASHWIGLDAFQTIQAGVDHVIPGGFVYVAAGTYAENVIIPKPLFLIGPNAGITGGEVHRRPEARVIPCQSDPENAAILSVESEDIVVDGLFLDGNNPQLPGGYNANGLRVHAAAGIQNGCYPDLADVEGITIRNNIITNISYDGICLDRYQYFGTSSAWNYIRNNKLANMWEGILTYSLDSVIGNNLISNVTHGLSVHCVTTSAPKGFTPIVASNTLWIAQWWPTEIQVARAPGIWLNYRRERASPMEVLGNVVNTPIEAPALKTIIGLFALTVDGAGEINFIGNEVNGQGQCEIGFLSSSCLSNQAVQLCAGALKNIRGTGVLVDTLDSKWGPGNCSVTVSNVEITMSPEGVGVLALQQAATPVNSASVDIRGMNRIQGGLCGVQIQGPRASASVIGKRQLICGNKIGIEVDGGRALVEGNILTNNQLVAIKAENGGVVDAGDCSGSNLTGLGTGNGPNGASAGLNDLSGYGCDKKAPWAIDNSSLTPILADRNSFNVASGERIADAIHGLVHFSDFGNLTVIAPPPIYVDCLSEVPKGAETSEDFVAEGGLIMGGSPSDIWFHDTVTTNESGHYSVVRRYTLSGGCDQSVSCDQLITANDNRAPVLHCSADIVQAVDDGCDYATVTFTNLAADSCGELLGQWAPVTTGRFPIGTNRIIVVATDLANNTSACSFEIAVVWDQLVTKQPLLRILGCSQGIVTLEVDGAAGDTVAILQSTDLANWAGLYSNVVPYRLLHTNAPGPGYRFYRARRES